MNAIAFQRKQYPMILDSSKTPPFHPEKMIFKTQQSSFEPVIKPKEPAIKKI